MKTCLPKVTVGSVASLLAATLYQGNADRNHFFFFSTLIPNRRNFNHKIYTESVNHVSAEALTIGADDTRGDY
jgi:hypothetical protein